MRAIDWLLRTVLLMLACLATLSLIGALASVSGGSLGDAFPGRVAVPSEATITAGDLSRTERGERPAAVPDAPGAGSAVLAAAPGSKPEIERWLKALTYAVLALAGFAAAGVVALLRIASQLGRITLR